MRREPLFCECEMLSGDTVKFTVPNNIFNDAERVIITSDYSGESKTFPAEAFGSDSWISVKDHTPDIPLKGFWSKSVYAYDKEREQVRAIYNKNGEWEEYYNERPLYKVTHWVPLPDDPQEVNND